MTWGTMAYAPLTDRRDTLGEKIDRAHFIVPLDSLRKGWPGVQDIMCQAVQAMGSEFK
jgi:hypothetical protein